MLTCSSRCAPQEGSAPRSLASFPCSHLSLPMRSPESECTSLALFLLSFHLFPPTRSLGRECPSLSLAFLLCLQLSLPMRSPESVCPALSPSSHVLICPS